MPDAQSWRRFLPAHDNPVSSQNQVSDYARTRLVADQVARLLHGMGSGSTGKTNHSAIGLLGGLGQGKTSALHSVQDTLKLEGKRCEWFDVAHFKPDQLEYEFDRLQASLRFGKLIWLWLWRGLARFGLLALLVAAAVLAVWLGAWLDIPLFVDLSNLLPYALGKIKVAQFVKVGGFLLGLCFAYSLVKESTDLYRRAQERAFLLPAADHIDPHWLKRFWHALTRPFFRFDVLFIDNLDRASKTQQRALLRSLYKYKGNLPYSVVIAFDEAGVLESDPDPEPPRELLLKAIQVVVRIPDRQPFEHLLFARLACDAESDTLQPLLRQPRVFSALANLLYLAGSASPRRAKRLLNDSLARLAQNHGVRFVDALGVEAQTHTGHEAAKSAQTFQTLPDSDRLLAMLRITVLLELAPKLRAHQQLLIQLLAHVDSSTEEHVQECLSGTPQATEVLRHSRAYRPQNNDWRDIVSMSLAQTYAKVETAPIPSSVSITAGTDLYTILQRLWNAIDLLAHAGDDTELLLLTSPPDDSSSSARFVEDQPWVFPVLSIYLLAQPDNTLRWRLLQWFRHALESGARWFEGNVADTRFWVAELAFSQLDVDQHLVTEADIQSWLNFGASDSMRRAQLLLLYPPSRLCLHQALRLLVTNASEGVIPAAAPLLRPWFASLAPRERLTQPSAKVSADIPIALASTTARLVETSWPSLTGADAIYLIDQLSDQIELYRDLHRQGYFSAASALAGNAFHNIWLLQSMQKDPDVYKLYWSALQKLWCADTDKSYERWMIGPARDLVWGSALPISLEYLSSPFKTWSTLPAVMLSLIAALRNEMTFLQKFWDTHNFAQVLGSNAAYLRLLYLCIEENVKRATISSGEIEQQWESYLAGGETKAILKRIFVLPLANPAAFVKLAREPGFSMLS